MDFKNTKKRWKITEITNCFTGVSCIGKEQTNYFFLQSNFSSFSLKEMTFDRINKIAQQSSKPHFSHWNMWFRKLHKCLKTVGFWTYVMQLNFVYYSCSGGPRFFYNLGNYIYTKFHSKNWTVRNLLLH